MSISILEPTTAGIYPNQFPITNSFSHKYILMLVFVFLLLAFGLRIWNLGSESLGEDELNKLQTVNEYRNNGLSGRNGEHPFLMKGLQTISIYTSEKLNNTFPNLQISEESALRFPTILIGSLTVLILYLLLTELFGSTIGLITAALWAVNPTAIGFDRIAKEDSFLLFFFLLANFFLIRSQTVAETESGNPKPYYWATAIALAAMLASKYLIHIMGIGVAYYFMFQQIPATKWRLGKILWLKFFVIMGIAFVIFNPTILLPDTWREMLTFSGEKRIGHDAYEFMGQLYPNKMTLWLKGVPWTFYYVFIAFKTPILTLIACLIGIFVMWRKKLGDGRYFIFFWTFMWFMPFSVLGGKFTRYFAVAQPIVLIAAAFGICFLAELLAKLFNKTSDKKSNLILIQAILFIVVVSTSLFASISVNPHYRLFTNTLGGGENSAGYYFPHDEFYDLSSREIITEIIKNAEPNAKIASETPVLLEFYAKKLGRSDFQFVSLSDKDIIGQLAVKDFIVVAEGRRYFSNTVFYDYLKNSVKPLSEIKTNGVISARIYQLDETSKQQIQGQSK